VLKILLSAAVLVFDCLTKTTLWWVIDVSLEERKLSFLGRHKFAGVV